MLSLTDNERRELERCLDTSPLPKQVFLRLLILLACAEGRSDNAVAEELKINRKTVRLWRERFLQRGPDAVWEIAPGRGRKTRITPQRIQSLVQTARPAGPGEPTLWRLDELAAHHGISKSAVSDLLAKHHIRTCGSKHAPHSTKIHVPEQQAIVGLFVNPPYHSFVISLGPIDCSDAWDLFSRLHRVQDNREENRNDVAAALAVVTSMAGAGYPSISGQALFNFVRRLDRSYEGEIPLHMIVASPDSASTRALKTWVLRNPRFRARFVRSASTWIDAVTPALTVLLAEDLDPTGAEALSSAIEHVTRLTANEPFVWMRNGSLNPPH